MIVSEPKRFYFEQAPVRKHWWGASSRLVGFVLSPSEACCVTVLAWLRLCAPSIHLDSTTSSEHSLIEHWLKEIKILCAQCAYDRE